MANYCQSCGKMLASGENYCSNCGAPVNGTNSTSTYQNTNRNHSVFSTLLTVGILSSLLGHHHCHHGFYHPHGFFHHHHH